MVKDPFIHIVICPRCGSIYYRNKWVVFRDLDEFIKKSLLENQKKLLDANVRLEDVEITDEFFHENTGIAKALFRVCVSSVSRTVPINVKFELSRKICPRCTMSVTGSYRVLLQFRAEGRPLDAREVEAIDKIISNPLFIDSIVEKQVVKHGVDVKVSSLPVARAIVKRAVNELNVKITETFKSKRFDSQRGVWVGETVLSLRIPSISKNVIVEYSGELWIIREVGRGTILLESLENGRELKIDLEQYWRGNIRVMNQLDDFRTARIVGYDSRTLYLLDDTSGEIIEMPRRGEGLNQGERVYIVELRDKVFLVRESRDQA